MAVDHAVAEDDLTEDGFLGGRITALQSRTGFRSGIDTVLLAAAIDARPGDAILELGCGVGIASLCLSARIDNLHVTGLDICAKSAELARRNATRNGRRFHIHVGDVANPPDALLTDRFDHVFANPPYQRADAGTPAATGDRRHARRESSPLARWVALAGRLLKRRGALTMIFPPDRLPEFLSAAGGCLDTIRVCPIYARRDGPCRRLIVHASRAGPSFSLSAPVYLHHDGRRDYTSRIEAALRRGEALAT